jgi:hypothetical protein
MPHVVGNFRGQLDWAKGCSYGCKTFFLGVSVKMFAEYIIRRDEKRKSFLTSVGRHHPTY